MVELLNRDDVEHWLITRSRDDAVVMAARAALRVLPAIGFGLAPWRENKARDDAFAKVLPTLRATNASWIAVKYPTEGMAAATRAAAFSALRGGSAASFTAAVCPLAAAKAAASTSNVVVSAASVFDAASAATTAAVSAAARAANSAATFSTAKTTAAFASSVALTSDAEVLQGGMPTRALATQPLWPAGVPDWAETGWVFARSELLARNDDWQVWIDWYEERRDGRRVQRKAIEIARVRPAEFFGAAGPRAVNAEIRRLIEANQPKEKPKNGGEPTPDLGQRSSSHRFAWQRDKLEAIAVTEPPFDPELAEVIREALIEKAADLLAALVGDHADPIVSRDVQRALDLIAGPVDGIAEGLLLMRSNTIASHSRAYANADSPRERAIRALLDDFSTSLGNLVDCYPGVRRINVNRLELEVQAADVPAITAELDAVTAIARQSEAVAATAVEALKVGQEEAAGLGAKIEMASGEVRAGYMKARAEVVASRVLNTTNFVSATAQKAQTEQAGVKAETLRELRKTLPKPLARGVSKATEKAITNLPDAAGIGMAYLIAEHWGALAVLVGRLAPHARKIQQIADAIDKVLRGESEDGQSSDEDP